MGIDDIRRVDHRDQDGLNNRRTNLRVATQSQNLSNRGPQKNNTSGYKGVSLCKATGRWQAIIQYGRKKKRLGRFDTPEQAALAYDKAAVALMGEFAVLNIRPRS
jgi:hypothetical protein